MKIFKNCLSKNGFKVLRQLQPVANRFQLILAGGTALSLQIGHRISEDLDFFTTKNFDNNSILASIKQIRGRYQLLMEDAGTLTITLDGVKVSFLKYEYPFLDTEVSAAGVPLADLLDISTMKIIAICQRRTKRDFVDLFFILQTIPFHQIVQRMYQRFGKERINPLHIGKALVYFSDAESHPEPQYLKNEIKWPKIKQFFKNHVKQFVLDMTSHYSP